ncbi:MAG: DUF4412 domain-containing protein [Flavobacteriales bacterium]|jgi:hypothetical protein|nr:DUF4412 domain-containing protein [Flavobacteriales bacterium]
MRTPALLTALLLSAATLHAQSLQDLMKAAGQKEKVTVEEDNTPFKPLGFTGSYRWEIHSYKNGTPEKDSPTHMVMAFDDAHMAMVPQAAKGKEEMRMLFDLKNKHTYTLMTDKKGQRSGIKMKSMRIHVQDDTTATDDDIKVKRTNETKTIEGHTCRKYTYSNADGHGEAWIAEGVKFNAFAALGHMVGGKTDDWQKAPYHGLVMESVWNDKNGRDRVEMFTRDLVIGRVDAALFSTAGYEVQDMTNMPLFGR